MRDRLVPCRGTLVRARTLAVAVVLLTGVMWSSASDPHSTASAGKGVQIQIKNFAFGPATITVKAGQKLTWTNDDVVPHTATAKNKRWDSGQVAPGGSFTVTVTKPGTFVYACLNHPFMQAKVIVTK